MQVIKDHIKQFSEGLEQKITTALQNQRTELAGSPEVMIRALALQQMADYYENQAQNYFRFAETYEAEECRNIARHALMFKARLLEGKVTESA
ncbi:TPA: hypothetical protein I9Y37_001907 [Citrobacter freundii]|nr:hypothetical protein [Citrobacter freundii]HAT3963882.1 hypothetical protein [Citrobacter freundii]